MTRFLSTLCAASALALTVGAADAATVTITGITGTWVDTDPNEAWHNSIWGTDTSEIRWGDPASGSKQSGYNFNKADTPLTAAQDDEFKLGQFEHLNYPITGTSITAATLQVVFSFMLEGETTARQLTSKFLFEHNETTNDFEPLREWWQAQKTGRECQRLRRPSEGQHPCGRVADDRTRG